jgi:tetratricopeptide (TPR) repeat protein
MDNLSQRGATFQQLEQHERAIEDFTKVISLDQNSAQAYYARSRSYRAIGKNAEADQDHRQGRINDAR